MPSRIREALKAIGGPADSRSIASVMIKDGFPAERNGKPLRFAVAVELFRLAKNKKNGIQKVAKGLYRIETQPSEVG